MFAEHHHAYGAPRAGNPHADLQERLPIMQALSVRSEGLSTYLGKGGIAGCFDRDPVFENPHDFLQPVSSDALLT